MAAGAQFCNNCGARAQVSQVHQAHQMVSAGSALPMYESSFIQYVHSFGKSSLFLVGIALFSVGSVFNALITLGGFGIFSLALLALPIIGMWLLYAASKRPTLPDKSFTALSLFKAHTIITLVLFCIALGGSVLIILAVFALGSGFGFPADSDVVIALAIIGFIAIGVMVLYLIFYFVSLLRIIESLRKGMTNNSFAPLRGVTPFLVIAWISVVLGVLGALSTFALTGFIE